MRISPSELSIPRRASMDEIQQLQAEFMRLQKQQSSSVISERVSVEILLKLLSRNMVHVHFTTDRREFVTPSQLIREIHDEIILHNGRLELSELFPLFQLDERIVESAARQLVDQRSDLLLISNSIVSTDSLENIAEEIQESLQEAGHLNLRDLASRFSLPLDTVTNLIRARLVSAPPSRCRRFITGSLAPPILYTDAFLARHSSSLRGMLTAMTIPTSLMKIQQQFDIDDDLFFTIFDKLLQSGRVPGAVEGRGDGKEFVPAIYHQHRTRSIESFYHQNGYLEYDTLSSQYQILQPQKYLKSTFPEGIALSSVFLSPTQVDMLDATLEETVAANEWIHASTLLPSPLTREDVELVLRDHCTLFQAKKPTALLMHHTFVVSCGFLSQVLQSFEDHFTKWAAEDSAARKDLLVHVEELRSSTSSLDSESQEEDDAPAKSKKKRRAPKTKRKKNTTDSSRGQQYAENLSQENKKLLVLFQPDLPFELIEAIESEIRSRLIDMREAAARAIFMESSANKKFVGNAWHVEVQQLFCNILLFHRSAHAFRGDSVPLDRHLIRTLCADLVNLLVEAAASHNMVQLEGESIQSTKQRNAVLKQLESVPIHASLVALGKSKTSAEFITNADSVFDHLGIPSKPLDKESESILVKAHQDALQAQFTHATHPAEAFHLGVMVLYIEKTKQVLHVPGKMIIDVLQQLNSAVASAQDYVEIIRYGDRVKEFLVTQMKQEMEVANGMYDALVSDLPHFKQLIEQSCKHCRETTNKKRK